MIMPLGPSATGRPDRTWRSSIARMGSAFPHPGLIVLGKIKAGVEALNVPGAIRATIELS